MHKHFTRARRALLAAALVLSAALPATAQTPPFPTKPVRIVIPTAPGGNMDVLARLYAAKLTEAWGQQVIVESRPGANTILATTAVAKAPADGYTALFTISGFIQNLVLQSNPQYKLGDLAPVSLVASFPIAMVANAALPANDLAGVVALARQSPEKYTFGSYGVGSGAHLIGEGLNKAAGIRIKHAAYKGEAASFTDVASGDIALAYGSVGFYANQLGASKVKLIAVAAPHRLKTFPDLPTLAELGYPDINLPGWGALFLPAGTPAPIVEKYVQEVRRITALPEVQARIHALGFEPVANTHTEFAQFLQEDLKRWTRIARENDIRLD
ncbi:tripartite tricarboxylate transporter substrate binding protein [Xenophilus arseniciresistens]|uniref:Tripartite tricarboxylate transporter substrate binding protein n=1 Tax=Xenophilus arseniciresistens TaxID=1283306 RepID=A0AAE3NET6_9BURK|nr:tripartite tricarboxylate transporter substrate binding protein [Xenophilus arseniciresistens]MDA7418977.1 tripartite tricarboxylate transporter substrate binding protein [Xenophilus arseniciresistens]